MSSGNPNDGGAAPESGPPEDVVFHAVLYPHRSLGVRGFRLLLCVLGAASTLLSIPFYLLGAWPVVGFFGVDVALLYVCFRLNYRDARREERVMLTYVRLLVSRIDPRGRRHEWRFNPLWVRLRREEHDEFGLMRLALVERQDEVELARFLGAQEKAEFANAFQSALARARRGPVGAAPS
jgi:uncharacterized membrane protein